MKRMDTAETRKMLMESTRCGRRKERRPYMDGWSVAGYDIFENKELVVSSYE